MENTVLEYSNRLSMSHVYMHFFFSFYIYFCVAAAVFFFVLFLFSVIGE